MARNSLALLVCVTGLAMAAGVVVAQESGPGAGADTASNMSGERLAWIRTVDSQPGSLAILHVRYQERQRISEPIVFECETRAETNLGLATAALHVFDPNNKIVEEGSIDVLVGEGITPFRFQWDASGMADGRYRVRIELFQSARSEWAWQELSILKLSTPNIQQDIETASKKLDELKDHIEQMDSEPSPYTRVRMAIAEDFLREVQHQRSDWRRVQNVADYVVATVDSVRAQLTFGRGLPHGDGFNNRLPMDQVSIDDGVFMAGGRPVFLAGVRGLSGSASEFERLQRYGLNLAVIERALEQGDVSPEGVRRSLGPVFESAKNHNVAVHYLVTDSPFHEDVTADPELPRAVMRRAKSRLEPLAAYLAGQDMLLGMSIAHLPKFHLGGEKVRDGFVEYARNIYEDRTALNRAWRTRLISLDEIEVWRDYNRPAYQYDWQTYHTGLATDLLREAVETVHQLAPDVPLQINFGNEMLTADESRYTVDYDALSIRLAIAGTSVAGSADDPLFAVAFPRERLTYALWRSLSPGKPLFNVEDRGIRSDTLFNNDPFRFVHSYLWEAAIEGVSAFATWDWPEGADARTSFLTDPRGAEGFSIAALDINRLMPIVKEFHRAPADVGILLGRSARIHEGGEIHLASVKRAFQGVSFVGRKVRFVTEDQLAADNLDQLELLVVPNTPALDEQAFQGLQEYTSGGGVVVRASTPIPYDAHGASRNDVVAYGPATFLVRGTDAAMEYMSAMDAALDSRLTDARPRAVNRYGYPLEGVRTRYVEKDGESYLYLINLRKTPVPCFLHGDRQQGFDLISGNHVEFPRRVSPLIPMLIRLDRPQPTRDLAMEPHEPEEGRGADDVPTATVRPIAEPSS